MTQYPGIVKRAELVAWKSGKIFAKPDGKLSNSLFVLSSLLLFYTFFINLFYVLGTNMIYQDTPNYSEVVASIISVAVADLLLIVAFILGKMKRRVLSSIILIAVSSFLTVFFGSISKADISTDGFLGFKPLFYWRHFIPLFLIFVFAVWMIIIVIRSKHKFAAIYKSCEEELYSLYKTNNPEASTEDWTDFAKSYDGTSPQKLFQKKKNSKETTDDIKAE